MEGNAARGAPHSYLRLARSDRLAMNGTDQYNARFDTRTGKLIRRCLRICEYHEDLIEENYPLSDSALPFVSFAHRPHDARSSCIAFLPHSETPREDLAGLRELGVPLIFFVADNSWEMWSLRSEGSRRERGLKVSELEGFFATRKTDFAPGAVFRAKTWARAEEARQLDFVDVGLLPLVEREAGSRLRQLFESMVAHTTDVLGLTNEALSDADAHWLVQANFWLLAGKLLRDKSVPKFASLDLLDVQNVFDRVAEHYGAKRVRTNGRLTALRAAAHVAADFSSLRTISTETLGALYEEALLSESTRKLLSIHRTPTYLVDYMLAKLSGWMAARIGFQNCRIFEPACGHAPFLVGAVRMLSDMLPNEIAADRPARRLFLRKHISGCDRDPFALEIARLSLTLADIPNPNGWDLDPVVDMFVGDYLDDHIAKASVVLVNPPFEHATISKQQRASGDLRHHRNGQSAEMLRRLLRSLQPGAIFGAVVPQSLLEGKPFLRLRRDLLDRFEIREITVFADKVFQFADVETAIILGRRVLEKTSIARSFTFRRVREADMPKFVTAYLASTSAIGDIRAIKQSTDACLVIPDLLNFWDFLKGKSHFTKIATIGNGFIFLSKQHPDYPAGELTVSSRQADGFTRGFANVSGSPETHLLPSKSWLNQKPGIIACERSGTLRGTPQVLLNHVRVSRQPWRLKAFIDPVGCPATGAFLLIRSKHPNWSIHALWALCNSPIANAYTYTHSSKKHIMAGFLRKMPVPALDVDQRLDDLEEKVQTYLAAARDFSAKQLDGDTKRIRRKHTAFEKTQLLFNEADVNGSGTKAASRDYLRTLHWRIDAEVLRLYALTPELERQLLNLFDGVKRVGVPFEQTRYIPLGCPDVYRLSDFLRITDDWEMTDARRCELIEKRIKNGHRSATEEVEFKELQRLFDLHRRYYTPDPLFDEAKLRELQEEDDRVAQSM